MPSISHPPKTCDPCQLRGNPTQTQTSRSGQKTVLEPKVPKKARQFVWQVSHDQGCHYQVIPEADGPTYTLIPTQKDDGNLYRVIITEKCGRQSEQIIQLSIETSWVNHTVYVDSKYGNDQTGQVENLLAPFQTVEAAIQAIKCSCHPPSSTDHWCIWVRCGTYPIMNDLWLPSYITISGAGIDETTLAVSSFIGFNGDQTTDPDGGVVVANLTVSGSNQPVIQTRGGAQPAVAGAPAAASLTMQTAAAVRTDRPGSRSGQALWREGTEGQARVNAVTVAVDNTPLNWEIGGSVVYKTGSTNYGYDWVAGVYDSVGSNYDDFSLRMDFDPEVDAAGNQIGSGARARVAAGWVFDPPPPLTPRERAARIRNAKLRAIAATRRSPQIEYFYGAAKANIDLEAAGVTVFVDNANDNIRIFVAGITVGDGVGPENVTRMRKADINFFFARDEFPGEVYATTGYGNVKVSANYVSWGTPFIPGPFPGILPGTEGLPNTSEERVRTIEADNQADLRVDGNLKVGGDIDVDGNLNVPGGLCGQIQTFTSAITLTAVDYIVLGDTTDGGFTITLPDPATVCRGKTYYVKNSANNSNALTLDGNGANIDIAPTLNINDLESYQVVSDGSQWWIIANFT